MKSKCRKECQSIDTFLSYTRNHWYLAVIHQPSLILTPMSLRGKHTTVYILDSLGRKHRETINCLSRYLQLEAKEKRGCTTAHRATGCEVDVSSPFKLGLLKLTVIVLQGTSATKFHRLRYIFDTLRPRFRGKFFIDTDRRDHGSENLGCRYITTVSHNHGKGTASFYGSILISATCLYLNDFVLDCNEI